MSTLFVNTISPNSGDTVSVSGSLFVSGTINLGDDNTDSVSFGADISSSIIPNAANTYDLGSVSKPWRKLHGTASAASHSLTAFTATSASHLVAAGFNAPSVSPIFSALNVNTAITASVISCSGTIRAAAFEGLDSTPGNTTMSFNDNLFISGNLTASNGISASSATFTTDVIIGDDLSLSSDGAIFNMGADNDFKITHDGANGALIRSAPISILSVGSALSLSGSSVSIDATGGDVAINSSDDVIISAPDEIQLHTTSTDGHISISSSHAAGVAVHIDANANAGSIVDIDAGILDIDVTGAATVDAVGIALSAGAGELDLTTTGIMDINADTLDMDLANSSSITLLSNQTGEDLTIALTGATDSSLILSSSGTGADAIKIETSAGSIDINSQDDITIDASDNITVTAADNVTVQSSTADGLVTLYSGHTAGTALHIDANAAAGSILDVDAGILDIDVTGAATVDADSITLTGAVTAATGVQSSAVARTATDDGSGNGTIAAGTSVVLVDADSDANHIIILPAPVVGNIITIIENGTTGYELRTSTPASIGINGGTGANAESAIAGATTYIRCVCVSSTAWIATQFAADGTESKVEAAA